MGHGRGLGIDAHSGQTGRTHSVLLESEAILDRSNTLFGRAEVVQKSAEELVLPQGPGAIDPERTFNLGHVSLGYIREVGRMGSATIGLGVRGTLDVVPSSLAPFYGSRSPTGFLLFVRLRPWHQDAMSSMPGMRMQDHGRYE